MSNGSGGKRIREDRWTPIAFWRFQDRAKGLGEFIPGGDRGGGRLVGGADELGLGVPR